MATTHTPQWSSASILRAFKLKCYQPKHEIPGCVVYFVGSPLDEHVFQVFLKDRLKQMQSVSPGDENEDLYDSYKEAWAEFTAMNDRVGVKSTKGNFEAWMGSYLASEWYDGPFQNVVFTYVDSLAAKQRAKLQQQIATHLRTHLGIDIRGPEQVLCDTGFRQFLTMSKHVPSKIQQVFALVFSGSSRAEVAAQLHRTQTTVSQWIAQWAAGDNGLCFEVYFKRLVGDQRPGRSAKHTPDAVGSTGTIYSLKSVFNLYSDLRYNPIVHFKPEWDATLEQGTTFWFVLARPELWDRFVVLEIDPREPPRKFTVNRKGGILLAGEKQWKKGFL